MNLKPLDDRIVVQPNEAETQTASGLVIPDTAKEKPQQGEVLAVGPGKRAESTGELIPTRHQVGDASSTRSTAAPRSPSTATTCSSSTAATCSRSWRSDQELTRRQRNPTWQRS